MASTSGWTWKVDATQRRKVAAGPHPFGHDRDREGLHQEGSKDWTNDMLSKDKQRQGKGMPVDSAWKPRAADVRHGEISTSTKRNGQKETRLQREEKQRGTA